MDPAKVQLSGEEMALVKNAGWILTKNSVIGKTVKLFAGLSEEYKAIWKGDGMMSGKVSRGENYQGLPWVMLDYPRVFGREDVLAIRTMFWWGHYFSVTLHLKGIYQERFSPAIRHAWPVLSAAGFYIGISDDEWRHELSTNNYLRIGEVPGDLADKILTDRPFLKLSAHCELDKWNEGPEILSGLFRVLSDVLQR